MTDVEVWTSTAKLDALTVTINDEYRLANESATGALQHAFACGQALLDAHELIPEGEWERWLITNVDIAHSTAARWQRLAFHRVLVEASGLTGVEMSIGFLSRLGAPRRVAANGRLPTFDVAEARRLRKLGWTFTQIGEVFGVVGGTVRKHCDPSVKRKEHLAQMAAKKKRRAANRALAQLELDRKINAIGGDVSTLYSWLRKGAVIIDRAILDASDEDYRIAMRSAQAALTTAEGAIVKALRLK